MAHAVFLWRVWIVQIDILRLNEFTMWSLLGVAGVLAGVLVSVAGLGVRRISAPSDWVPGSGVLSVQLLAIAVSLALGMPVWLGIGFVGIPLLLAVRSLAQRYVWSSQTVTSVEWALGAWAVVLLQPYSGIHPETWQWIWGNIWTITLPEAILVAGVALASILLFQLRYRGLTFPLLPNDSVAAMPWSRRIHFGISWLLIFGLFSLLVRLIGFIWALPFLTLVWQLQQRIEAVTRYPQRLLLFVLSGVLGAVLLCSYFTSWPFSPLCIFALIGLQFSWPWLVDTHQRP